MKLIWIGSIVVLAGICFGTLPADFDCNGNVDVSDLSIFSYQWLGDQFSISMEDLYQAGLNPEYTTKASKGVATFTIAASDALDSEKYYADFICDGIDDQIEIQNAVDALNQLTDFRKAGTIYLSSGIFYISEPIILGGENLNSIVNIYGTGSILGTRLKLADQANCSVLHIGYDPRKTDPNATGTVICSWVDLYNICFDGNSEAQNSNQYNITAVNKDTGTITVTDPVANLADIAKPYEIIRIFGSTANDGYYTVESVTGNSIKIVGELANNTTDGKVKCDPPIIDAVGWQDGTIDRCFVMDSIGSGIQIKKAWTITITRCPIEHHYDTGILMVTDINNYTQQNVMIDKNVFINDQTLFSPHGVPSGPTIYISSRWTQCNMHSITNNLWKASWGDGIVIKGSVMYTTVADNRMQQLGLDSDLKYYGILLQTLPEGFTPDRMAIVDNIIDTTDTTHAHNGNTLRAAVGILGAEGVSFVPDRIIVTDNIFRLSGDTLPVYNPDGGNPNGRMFDVVQEHLTNVLAEDVPIQVTINDTGPAQEIIDISTGTIIDAYVPKESQPKYSRSIRVILNDVSGLDLSGNIYIYGYDFAGASRWEQFPVLPGFNTRIIETEKVFAEIHKLRFVMTNASPGDTAAITIGSKFLLTNTLYHSVGVISVVKNSTFMSLNSDQVKEYSVDYVNNTIDFAKRSDGSDGTPVADGDSFVVRYRKAINLVY